MKIPSRREWYPNLAGKSRETQRSGVKLPEVSNRRQNHDTNLTPKSLLFLPLHIVGWLKKMGEKSRAGCQFEWRISQPVLCEDGRGTFHSNRVWATDSFWTSKKQRGHYLVGPLIHLPPEIDTLWTIHELYFSERQIKENPTVKTWADIPHMTQRVASLSEATFTCQLVKTKSNKTATSFMS